MSFSTLWSNSMHLCITHYSNSTVNVTQRIVDHARAFAVNTIIEFMHCCHAILHYHTDYLNKPSSHVNLTWCGHTVCIWWIEFQYHWLISLCRKRNSISLNLKSETPLRHSNTAMNLKSWKVHVDSVLNFGIKVVQEISCDYHRAWQIMSNVQ